MEKDNNTEGGKKIVSVVLPALNEEKGIKKVLDGLREAADHVKQEFEIIDHVEIIVVDDGSTDRTAEIAEEVKDVSVVRQAKNGGYGHAIKTGFSRAHGDWLVFLDADGTYPPSFLVDLVREMIETDADIILGSRLSGQKTGMPMVRKTGNLFFAHLLSWITGKKITDTASGMRILKKSALSELDKLPDGLNYTPAMSTSALHRMLDIREIPMPYDERVGGSKLNPITDGLRFLWTILRTAHRYNPMKMFGLLGAICLVVAIVLGISPLAYYIRVQRVEDWEIYRLTTVIVLAVAGINIIFFGVVSNIIMAAIHRLPPYRNSILAKLLLRPFVIRHLWFAGIILMIAAPALNYEGLYTYFTTGKVYLHWSYTLTGSMLFLLGISLVLWGSLVRVVEGVRLRLEEKKAQHGP